MDAPRRWQVASLATAVASISIGGLMLSRPTSEAVAPIALDRIADTRELSVASPSDTVSPSTSAADPIREIVTPEPIDSPVQPLSEASVASPDDETSNGSTTTTTQPRRPAPEPAPAPADPDSPDSVDSGSSIDF